MAARYCVECGGLVTTSYCPNCGAFQPPAILDPSDTGGSRSEWTQTGSPVGDSLGPATGGAWSAQDSAPPVGSESAWSGQGTRPPGSRGTPAQGGSGSWWQESIGREQPADPTSRLDPVTGGWPMVDPAPTTALPPQPADQPYRPFEQSWSPPSPAPGLWSAAGPAAGDANFMGVSSWEADAEAPPPPDGRRSTLIAVFAVIAVLVAIGAVVFVVLRSQSTDRATSNDTPSSGTTTASTSGSSRPQTSNSQVVPPAVTVTVTPSGSSTTSQSSNSAAPDPLGGPEKNIACGPGFIVQVASAGDEAGFRTQVASLRAANRVPKDVFRTQVSASCPIFSGQSNSWVLYAGPFNAQYEGCAARLASAPDSFIRGTTPDTAKQYISCLCPADPKNLPTITAVGQTGVWVGELQRILANKLNIKINDLGSNWGTFTGPTSDAVKKFQKDKKLPENGLVDTVTWQALRSAQC